jgi:hypothetical protein
MSCCTAARGSRLAEGRSLFTPGTKKNKKPWFHTQGRNPIPRVHNGAISRGIRAYFIRTRRLICRIRHSNAIISTWTGSVLTSVAPKDS